MVGIELHMKGTVRPSFSDILKDVAMQPIKWQKWGKITYSPAVFPIRDGITPCICMIK